MTPPSPSETSVETPNQSPSEPTTAPPAPESSRLFRRSQPPPLDPGPHPVSPATGPSPLLDESPTPSGPVGVSASAPRSTGKFRARELRETARAAVRTAGGALHRLLTRRHSPERQLGLFLPDSEDEKAIGDPLASLASRRLPTGADSDTFDLLRVGLAIVNYLSKQGDKKLEAEELKFAMAPPPDQDDDQEVTP